MDRYVESEEFLMVLDDQSQFVSEVICKKKGFYEESRELLRLAEEEWMMKEHQAVF